MADIQHTQIIFLRGPRQNLPEQLSPGEIGFATDDGTLVIGNDPQYGQPHYGRETFPYRNIEILTEKSVEKFRHLHGDRMREGMDYDYYSILLQPDRVSWTSVLVDHDGEYTEYMFEVEEAITAFIDYTVAENTSGEPIRSGQMILWYEGGELNLSDRASHARDRSLMFPANYDPRGIYERVQFRFQRSDDGQYLVFQYRNLSFDYLLMQFRVSRPRNG